MPPRRLRTGPAIASGAASNGSSSTDAISTSPAVQFSADFRRRRLRLRRCVLTGTPQLCQRELLLIAAAHGNDRFRCRSASSDPVKERASAVPPSAVSARTLLQNQNGAAFLGALREQAVAPGDHDRLAIFPLLVDEDTIRLSPSGPIAAPSAKNVRPSASMNVPSSTAALSEAWATVCLMTRYA